MQGGNRQPLVIGEGVKAGNTSPSGNYNPSVLVREATKKGYAEAIDNTMDAETIKQVGQLYPNSGNPQSGRIYSADGISPTMDTCSGGNRMPKVLIEGTVIDDTQGFDGTRYYDNVSPSLRASRSGLKVVTGTATKDGSDIDE